MSIIWKIVVGISIAAVLVVSFGIYVLNGPTRDIEKNLFMKTINQKTSSWDTRVDLTPTPLEIGVAYSQVENQLQAMGFKRVDGNVHATAWVSKEIGGSKTEGLKKFDEVAFTAPFSNFVCSIDYVVFAKFDETNHLFSAQGLMRGNACL